MVDVIILCGQMTHSTHHTGTIQVRSFHSLYSELDEHEQRERDILKRKTTLKNAIEIAAAQSNLDSPTLGDGFQRMEMCRRALNALDRRGWDRSYHQRYFHDNFIRACARVFWKVEPEGSFANDHQKILQLNG